MWHSRCWCLYPLVWRNCRKWKYFIPVSWTRNIFQIEMVMTVTLPYDPLWRAVDWALKNCPSYLTNTAQPGGKICYYFIDEAEATMFMLKWSWSDTIMHGMWLQFRHLWVHGDGLPVWNSASKSLAMNSLIGKIAGVIIVKVYLNSRMQQIVNGSCWGGHDSDRPTRTIDTQGQNTW